MTDPRERRRDPRQRSLLGASIQVGPGESTTTCLVRNIGPAGAKLALNEAIPLPAAFPVTIDVRRVTRTANVVWRRGDAVGVSFAPEPAAGTTIPLDLVRALRAIRAENAGLRGRLAAAGLDD
ncbi:PilZ domain-containing protein [Methylobacterium sp. J-090]|uniref:PilZ domain-containing protein n=1 Tax=Methylobacterium sp. J-090 TaxID=2836666 RepID=UPI001FBA7806|nr:PilZ domain-containing protein [Methylobacterium sp. J-090]MCJ2079963.1 PilZ domain-containing protein [Methylobacterium sp. J-090]